MKQILDVKKFQLRQNAPLQQDVWEQIPLK